MDAVGSSTNTDTSVPVVPPVVPPTTTDTTETNTSTTATTAAFDELMQKLISPSGSGEVSEESLFGAVIHDRLTKTKGAEAAEAYAKAYEANKSSMAKANGYVPLEDAAKEALRSLVSAGTLTAEEGDKIYSDSFAASQLDANTSVLFDDTGGANDPTKAVESLEKALLLASAAVGKLDSGELTAESRSLGEESISRVAYMAGMGGASAAHSSESGTGVATSASPVDGAGGFLFKPVSDSTGKLAVLAPSSLADMIVGTVLKDLDGNKIEEGTYSGNGNGGRDHYRFSKPGGSYPPNLTVEITMKNGEVKSYKIEDPSKRYD